MKDYNMYKYYAGEENNPFDNEQQNTAFQFWCYEQIFEHKFNTGNEFNKENKRGCFEKWLKELFARLSDKYECLDSGEYFNILYEKG
jgi:hypothetical protein